MSINIRNAVITILTGISLFRISKLVLKPAINAQIPTTTSPLKMFDPMILLIAISLLPESAAFMLTEASGALVPIATIVRPIITLGTLRILAREELPSTKKSAPLIKSAKPIINKRYSIIVSFPVIKVWNTSIKKETFTTSKMIDKSLVNYNNNRPLGVMTIIISPETDNQMKTTPF